MSDLGGIDWKAFKASIMRPRQPRLAEALGVVRDLWGESRTAQMVWEEPDRFAHEAWEAMGARLDELDLVDGSLRDDGRRFLIRPPEKPIRYTGNGAPRGSLWYDRLPRATLRRVPWDTETAVALMAAAPDAVRSAEELALEAARRLKPWGFEAVERVAWTYVGDRWPEEPGWSSAFDVPAEAALRAQHDMPMEELRAIWGAMGLPVYTSASNVSGIAAGYAQRMAASHAQAWIAWRRSVQQGAAARVGFGPAYLGPIPTAFMAAVLRRPFTEVEDPLDPLLEVWGLGFVPIDLRSEVMILGITLPEELSSLMASPSENKPRTGRRKRA